MSPEYLLREGEPLDRALKRFKRKLRQDGVLDDMRKREYYEKPSEHRKQMESAARRRSYLATLNENA